MGEETTSRRHYTKALDLQEFYEVTCKHYGKMDLTKGQQGGRSRDMFVYLAKKHTTALNREVGRKAGGITFSAVAQRYARIVKEL